MILRKKAVVEAQYAVPQRQILRGAPAKTKPTPRGGLWSRSLLMRLKRECTEERAAAARFAPVHAEMIAAIGAFRGHRRHRVVQVGRERRIKDLFVVAELVGGKRSEEHTSELQSQFHLVCRLL